MCVECLCSSVVCVCVRACVCVCACVRARARWEFATAVSFQEQSQEKVQLSKTSCCFRELQYMYKGSRGAVPDFKQEDAQFDRTRQKA